MKISGSPRFCNKGKCINPSNHFLLLKKGTNLEAFTDKLDKTLGSYQPDIEKINLQKLKNIYLTSESLETKTIPVTKL